MMITPCELIDLNTGEIVTVESVKWHRNKMYTFIRKGKRVVETKHDNYSVYSIYIKIYGYNRYTKQIDLFLKKEYTEEGAYEEI